MAPHTPDFRKELGITCLGCGRSELPPARDVLDNWTCSYCHAGFISVAMLANLLPRELLEQVTAKGGRRGKARSCPRCEQKMHVALVTDQGNRVELEMCDRCRLLWFDSGHFMRLLHLRPLDKMKEAALQGLLHPKLVGVRKPQTAGPEKAPTFIPTATLALCAVLITMALAADRWPVLESRLALDPAAPLRNLGLPWLTSHFVNRGMAAHLTLIPMLLLGAAAERHLGQGKTLWVFLTAGMLGRLAIALSGRSGPLVGSAEASLGLIACGLFSIPYGDLIFPKERFKSPINTVLWVLVSIGLVIALIVVWDYFDGALRNVLTRTDTERPKDTLLGGMAHWTATPAFRAYLLAAGVGIAWALTGSRGRPSEARPGI